jgi:1,4-dihydroxy-2-naphthoyl-CoA hydrolase
MSIWTGEVTVEQLNQFQQDTMAQHVGIVLTELGEDFLRGIMPVNERTCTPFGALHGGASVVLAESLGSVAANFVVDRQRQSCVGQEINANHVRSAPMGSILTGTARPLHLGSRSQVWSIDVVDASGALICVSRLTMAVLNRPRGLG